MNNSKILITGGVGFVGSNLVLEILEKFNPKEIIIVDNLLSSETINLVDDPKITFILGSISDDRVLIKLPIDIDYVFHLSCYHGNQSSIANPLQDHENNTLTSLKLFDWIKNFKSIKKVVYAAAGCAVAEKKYGVVNATKEDAPISLYHDSPYSISKLIGEFYGNYYFKQYNLPFVKARFQNIYGPREYLGAGQWRGTVNTIWRNVTPTFIWKSIHNEDLFLDNQGESSRDFIYVKDIVNGLILCALKGKEGEAYNLSSGVETTIRELASSILQMTESKSKIILGPKRDWDNSGNRFGCTLKSKNELGFEATVNLNSGISETVKWTKKNLKQISDLIKKNSCYTNG